MVRIKCTEEIKEQPAVIKVIGIGGAGGNAVNRMAEIGIKAVELIAANTDAQDLRRSKAPLRIQIGEHLTRGLGVGGDPVKGRQAALESKEQVRELLAGADMVFIAGGMGGGTGTGAAPVVAQVARELHALTVAVVTRPFEFEGRIRANHAEAGIKELRTFVDTLLIIPNDRIFNIIDEKTTTQEAFRKVDDVLRQGIQAISDVITTAGDINVDFADIRAIMTNAGEALMGIGEASGPVRALDAAKQAVHSPLLENIVMDGARGLIVNITGNKGVALAEIKEAMEFIHRAASPEANVKYGQAYDDSLKDRIKITVIATGFPSRKVKSWGKGQKAEPFPEVIPEFAREQTVAGLTPEELLKPAYLRAKPRGHR